jgi:hypothetical protein
VLGDFGGKQLELLKTAVPSITRVAVLIVPANPLHRPFFDDIGPAAAALKLKLQLVEARAADELERAFDAATRERADAVYVFGDPITFLHRRLVAELALRRRLPTMYLFKPNMEAGGLMSYGPSEPAQLRRVVAHERGTGDRTLARRAAVAFAASGACGTRWTSRRRRSSERLSSLRDPPRSVHCLEQLERALDQSVAGRPVSPRPEATVGQERLRQLGPGLDRVEHLEFSSFAFRTEQDSRRARGLKSAWPTGAFGANGRKPQPPTGPATNGLLWEREGADISGEVPAAPSRQASPRGAPP